MEIQVSLQSGQILSEIVLFDRNVTVDKDDYAIKRCIKILDSFSSKFVVLNRSLRSKASLLHIFKHARRKSLLRHRYQSYRPHVTLLYDWHCLELLLWENVLVSDEHNYTWV